jgi:hypothetical protein
MSRHLKRLAAAAATSVLISLAPPAQAAFNIVQASGANYVPVSPLEPCGAGFCRTWLSPARVQNLGQMSAANTMRLTNDLAAQRPAYTIDDFGDPLDISFNITDHEAFNTGSVGGGTLEIDYVGNPGFEAPEGLHWIQVITSNYNANGINGDNLHAPTGPGQPQNSIDAPGVQSPFYDEAAANAGDPFNATPPHFEDMPQRPEPTAANPLITWTGNLYLVADPDESGELTAYDGIRWGWYTRYFDNPFTSGVPEPSTWTTLILGMIAVGAWSRRRRARATG